MVLNKLFIVLIIFFNAITFAVNDEAILSSKPEKKLSEYGLFEDLIKQIPSAGVFPYILHSTLFSDYADKERFVYVPKGKKAKFIPNEVYDFPVGSVLVKTFSYPEALNGGKKLLETRLLLNQESGWKAHTYLWNEDQTEAFLKVTGFTYKSMQVKRNGELLSINYRVPNQNQCKECHLKNNEIMPIGPKSRNLNFSIEYKDKKANQISYWLENEMVENHIPLDLIVDWSDVSAPIEARARAYLDINCGHCHMPSGSADTTGLYLQLTETDNMKLGIFKKPVAAGRASGDLKYSIVPGKPDESIMLNRMKSLDPGEMMPESGRTTTHVEGISIVNDWIISLK
jgi:uncharacterized repeat protein (TIGR03806 family)